MKISKKVIFPLLSVVVLIAMVLTVGSPILVPTVDSGNKMMGQPLVADFAFDLPDCPCCKSIMFTDKTTGGVEPYSYDWDFGDGEHSTAQNPTHCYASNGSYTVTLTVVDSDSLPDSATTK
jgi:PKD repeat protein